MKIDTARYEELLNRWAVEHDAHLVKTEDEHWLIVEDTTGDTLTIPEATLFAFVQRAKRAYR